jgi:hypothetical protein
MIRTGYKVEGPINTPVGLRARARVRLDVAMEHPSWSEEHRRQMLIATQYERDADEMERRSCEALKQ